MSGTFLLVDEWESGDAGARKRLCVGEWTADPEANKLSRDGRIVRIEPKAMDLLMLLAARAGNVVTRNELLATIWPGVVVGDEALTQEINKLRKALGDNSRSPSYIETVTKRGYRLIAPVRRSEPLASPVAVASATGETAEARTVASPAPRAASAWRRHAALVGALALAALLAGAVFRNQPATLTADTANPEDARQPSWVTVSIVPFESLSADRDQTYFARGISDNLVTDLSRLSGLRLIRQSPGLPEAAGARYRVSGSVERDATMLRVNIHLVDTKTHEALWSKRLERPLGDLFAVEDEITTKLVQLLPAKVSEVERHRLAKRYTRNFDAYDDFLRAQALFLVRRSEQNAQAQALYRKAIELDPSFARAYAGLAMTYAMETRLRESAERNAALDRAYELAQTAVQIDPDIPETYWALAFVHAQRRRHDLAVAALRTAIGLDRSFADAYALLGGVLTYQGQPAQSIPYLRTAMRLNPDGAHLYFLLLGRAYLFTGDNEQALINLRAALLRNQEDLETHVYLAAALSAAGDRAGARWEADEIRSLAPEFATRRWLATYPMTSTVQTQRLSELLTGAGL